MQDTTSDIADRVRAALGADGPLARAIGPDYRVRQQQIDFAVQFAQMLERLPTTRRSVVNVRDTFFDDESGSARVWRRAMAQNGRTRLLDDQSALTDAIEAPTGTGKTFAYIVPALLAGQPIAVVTKTKALQDQLYEKDLPFLQQHLGVAFRAVRLKGLSNYLCLERLEREERAQQERQAHSYEAPKEYIMGPDGLLQRVANVPDDVLLRVQELRDDQAWDGDLQRGPFDAGGSGASTQALPPRWHAALRRDEATCRGKDCPFYNECYGYGARRRATRADVVVLNTALLLCDVKVNGHILPTEDAGDDTWRYIHQVLVIDEAHTLAEEARDKLGTSLKAGSVAHTLRTQAVRERCLPETLAAAVDASDALFAEINNMMLRDKTLRADTSKTSMPLREMPTLAPPLLEVLLNLLQQAGPLTPHDPVSRSISNLYARVEGVLTDNGRENVLRTVQWVKEPRLPEHIEATLKLVDVAPALRDDVFNARALTLATSATLSDGHKHFKTFLHETGMPNVRGKQLTVLPRVFDYATQVQGYVPKRTLMVEPNFQSETHPARIAYIAFLAEQITQLVRLSDGRALVPFPSKRDMHAVYNVLAQPLAREGFTLLMQDNEEEPAAQLVQRLRTTPKTVLFGLRSFEEGIDVPGPALSLVVVTRFPFAPMDDAMVQARMDLAKQRGLSPFMDIYYADMALRVRQIIGRLIRRETDTGVLAFLDTKLHDKPYAHDTLWSALGIPNGSSRLDDVRAFYARQRVPTSAGR